MSRAFGTPSTVTRNDPDLSCVALNEWFMKRWASRQCVERSSIPRQALFLLHLNTTVQERPVTWRFPHLNAILLTPHTIGSSMPVRRRPTRLAALSFCIFESPPTHAHTHPVFYCLALWCCYPLCLRRGKTLSCLKQNVCIYGKCTTSDISERNSQAWVYWPIQYSTTWIYLLQNQTDHALLHICLCIHMQRIELHVCMSMRPMVLSMICLIYGLDTLVNH